MGRTQKTSKEEFAQNFIAELTKYHFHVDSLNKESSEHDQETGKTIKKIEANQNAFLHIYCPYKPIVDLLKQQKLHVEINNHQADIPLRAFDKGLIEDIARLHGMRQIYIPMPECPDKQQTSKKPVSTNINEAKLHSPHADDASKSNSLTK